MSDGSAIPSPGFVGPLTPAPEVSEQPPVWLREWRALRDADQHLYLFGLRPESTTVRMTTTIRSADYRTRTWMTQSGRLYVAEVAPGELLTPEVLELAACVHGLAGPIEDVTDFVWAEMLRACKRIN
jgi:hypothetical protein